jgi:hypothetical protein
MLDRIDRLLEHELNWSAEETSCISCIICSVSSCPALLYCSMFRGISARRSSSAGPLRSRSGLRRTRIMASGHGRCASWCMGKAICSLGAGGGSARTTGSRKATSAPSTSSKPHCGMSTSCVTAKPCVLGISWSCMK